MTIDHDAIAAMVLRRRKVGAIGLLPDLPAAYLDLYDEVQRLRAVLESITKNTCREGCQEAALVAREALKEDSDE